MRRGRVTRKRGTRAVGSYEGKGPKRHINNMDIIKYIFFKIVIIDNYKNLIFKLNIYTFYKVEQVYRGWYGILKVISGERATSSKFYGQ